MFTINVPLPSFDKQTVKALKKVMAGMQEAANEGPVRGGVVSEGEAAAYALVWEYGNARQAKAGPKTTKGINPDGSSVWLSIQAPEGYIRINEADYIRILESQLEAMDFGDLDSGSDIRKAMKAASSRAAQLIADVVRDAAPKDSGDLADSIGPADPDDPDLILDDPDLDLGDPDFAHISLRRAIKKARKRR